MVFEPKNHDSAYSVIIQVYNLDEFPEIKNINLLNYLDMKFNPKDKRRMEVHAEKQVAEALERSIQRQRQFADFQEQDKSPKILYFSIGQYVIVYLSYKR